MILILRTDVIVVICLAAVKCSSSIPGLGVTGLGRCPSGKLGRAWAVAWVLSSWWGVMMGFWGCKHF